MLAMDLCVDTYHFRVGHVERMCRQMLSPFERESPTGTNSQAAEQRKCRYRGTVWVAGKPIPKKSKHAVRAAQIKAKSNKGRKRRKRAQQTVTVKKRLPLTKGHPFRIQAQTVNFFPRK